MNFKKTILFNLVVLIAPFVKGQEIQAQFEFPGYLQTLNIIEYPDSNFFLLGGEYPSNQETKKASSDELYLAKVNFLGDVVWFKRFGVDGIEDRYIDSWGYNNEILIVSTYFDRIERQRYVLFSLFDLEGMLLWQNKIEGNHSLSLSNKNGLVDVYIERPHQFEGGYPNSYGSQKVTISIPKRIMIEVGSIMKDEDFFGYKEKDNSLKERSFFSSVIYSVKPNEESERNIYYEEGSEKPDTIYNVSYINYLNESGEIIKRENITGKEVGFFVKGTFTADSLIYHFEETAENDGFVYQIYDWDCNLIEKKIFTNRVEGRENLNHSFLKKDVDQDCFYLREGFEKNGEFLSTIQQRHLSGELIEEKMYELERKLLKGLVGMVKMNQEQWVLFNPVQGWKKNEKCKFVLVHW